MAFMPNPLPPAIDYTPLAVPLARTMQAIGELNAASQSLVNPLLVIRPLQRQEALLSSAMEGTFTTANQLALAEADDDYATDAATLEVRNYIRAFETAQKLAREIPISNRLIREVHRTLLSQTNAGRGASNRPGEFKDRQNFISGGDRRIENARFIPPPPAESENAMAALEKFINREQPRTIPPIVESALIHYQFETIHPFADGNGRVGRILIPIHLMNAGVLDRPLLYLSPAVSGRKPEYIDLMLDVSRRGRWTEWIVFYLEVVLESCRSALATLRRLETLRRKYRDAISESGGSARYATIADDLFLKPVVSIPAIARKLSVTYPAAKNAVDRLVALGILDEIEGVTQPKRYICWEVVDISEGRPEPGIPNVEVKT
jgi:Fic family protein